MPRVMHHSFGPLLRAFVVIMPLMIGFAFLGIIVFDFAFEFSNMSQTLFLLVAMMNGDWISDVFFDITAVYQLIGFVYCMIVIFFAIT